MKILIKITKDVLRRSAMCRGNITENCAVALAVRDMFPESWMGRAYLCLSYGYTKYYYITVNNNVTQFIKSFDISTPAQRLLLPEFSFEIEVPQQLIDSIGIGEVYRILSESKTLELAQI